MASAAERARVRGETEREAEVRAEGAESRDERQRPGPPALTPRPSGVPCPRPDGARCAESASIVVKKLI